MRTAALAAKAALTTLIEGKKVNVISKSLDKYGRALVHIHTIQSAPVDVNQFMLDNGFAVPM